MNGIKGSIAGKRLRMKFDGIIKPDFSGKHGTEIINGHKHITNYSKKNITILRITKFIQKALWNFGIAIHDPIFGECTPDFNCCVDIGKRAFLKIPKSKNY